MTSKKASEPRKKPTERGRPDANREASVPRWSGFGGLNLILFALGVAVIVFGYVLLDRGSITAAPLLLIAGYVILLPLSILAGYRRL